MRRAIAIAFIFALFAQFAPSPAFAAAPIGKAVRLLGTATAMNDGTVRQLSAGGEIFQDEILETAPGARLEIVFVDGSSLTLGEGARLAVDEMVYSASDTATLSQSFSVLQGAFLFVTGGVGRREPGSVQVATPVATIGIRGTTFWGGPVSGGESDGPRFGVLILDGAVEVTSPQGAVVLDDPNEGTFLPLAGGVAPTEPGTWPQETIDEAVASVAFE